MQRLSDNNRKPGLDAIRSAAILLVMLHHFRHIPGCPEWLKWAGLRGYAGVDLFFVLSGWLIGGQLLRAYRRTGELDILGFWCRRWFRTAPPYLVIVSIIALQKEEVRENILAFLAFLQNYLHPHGWLISWSLCIEEHFYLVLPLLMWVVLKLFRGRMLAAATCGVLFIGISPLLRWLAFDSMNDGSYHNFLASFYGVSHLRLDGLAIGVLLAAAATFDVPVYPFLQKYRKAALAAGIALIATLWLPAWSGFSAAGEDRMLFYPAVPGFLIASIGTALLIPASTEWQSRGIIASCFTFVSEHAYTLYLTHEFTIKKVKHIHSSYWIKLTAAFLLSFVFAYALRILVEKPCLKLRDRLLSSRSRAGEPVASSSLSTGNAAE